MKKVMAGAVSVRAMMGMTMVRVPLAAVRVKKFLLPPMTRIARPERAPEGAEVDQNGI